MSDYFFFIGLPYAALAIMLAGSIYRFLNNGFGFSSLSSQFLESRELFWGSQPFHWGLFFLFFGHLIAFLFPSTVIAWNGRPLRLLIIETAAFAFGLSALTGLILLIIRRMKNKRIQIVTSKMDVFVFLILLVQIISGLWVAYFHRWGSSWFAISITPYLKSLFLFDPDIKIMAEMPLAVKIHVISAFIIIGIIPFTRFIHFLVYPIPYLWRSYQVFIWNWDRKEIRSQRGLAQIKKSTNN